jgi:hypothetical protein
MSDLRRLHGHEPRKLGDASTTLVETKVGLEGICDVWEDLNRRCSRKSKGAKRLREWRYADGGG